MFTIISETQANQLIDRVRAITGDATDYAVYDVLLGERTCLGIITSDVAAASKATANYIARCGLTDRWSGTVLKEPHGPRHHLLTIPGITVDRA